MTCRHCSRPDCPLLATLILGERNYVAAVRDCYWASKRRK